MRLAEISRICVAMCLVCRPTYGTPSAAAEKDFSKPAAGPRGPVGPDVPLSELEQKKSSRSIRPEGRTSAAVQAACDRAVKENTSVIFLPAGEYLFDREVAVASGLTVVGEGSKTICRCKAGDTHLFGVEGDQVRFTRLRLLGADTSRSQENDSFGITVRGRKNVRVDHCELLGFSYAISFYDEATGQVDHCAIHHNARDGLGYGVAIYSGAYVLMADNEFGNNRHSLATNGALDWGQVKPGEIRRHKPGFRKTHWEFVHNGVRGDRDTMRHWQVDTHPGMDGTFVVEGNLFEDLRMGVGITDGSGLIVGNVFRNLSGYRPVAIIIRYGTHNGVAVENAMPHDIRITGNTFVGAFEEGVLPDAKEHALPAKYRLGKAENITIDGKMLPETRKEREPPQIPKLQAMGDDGVLRWTSPRKEDNAP
ncbi:MAG: right-handed parallel beta-helix repeat-containing protein [Pirellulales bacterium]